MKTLVRTLLCAWVLWAGAGTATADEITFNFTWAFIDGLSAHHTASVLRYEQQSKADIRTLDGYVGFMASFEAQNRLLQQAASLIDPYQNDERLTKMGRKIAQGTVLEYLEVIKTNKAGADFIRAVAAPETPLQEKLKAMETASQVLIEIRSRREAVEVSLAQMSAGLSHVILGTETLDERKPKNIPTDAPVVTWAHLNLTRSERRQLILHLENFGPTVKQYVEKDETAAPAAACLLWTFLATSGFMASDEHGPRGVKP